MTPPSSPFWYGLTKWKIKKDQLYSNVYCTHFLIELYSSLEMQAKNDKVRASFDLNQAVFCSDKQCAELKWTSERRGVFHSVKNRYWMQPSFGRYSWLAALCVSNQGSNFHSKTQFFNSKISSEVDFSKKFTIFN